jgi:hypothetical protein
MRSITFVRNACLYLSLVAFFSVFASCTKDTPATVQAPAQSETYLYTAHSSDWAAPTTSDYTWEYFVYVSGIDSYILNSKAILVYYQDLNSNSTETLMPFTLNGLDYTYVTGVDGTGGYLKVNVTATDAIHDPSYISPVGFKVVIIPN